VFEEFIPADQLGDGAEDGEGRGDDIGIDEAQFDNQPPEEDDDDRAEQSDLDLLAFGQLAAQLEKGGRHDASGMDMQRRRLRSGRQ